jgi:hypothetical protein
MSKTTITRLFVGGIVAVVSGWVLGIVAILSALVGGAVELGGQNVVTVNGAAFASPLLVLAVAAILIAGGTVAVVGSWIGALVATARLEDKTWFVLLLVLGLWSFGVIAMVAYLVSGPDGSQEGAAGSIATAPGT